jgi:hypothetical protein
VKIGRLIAGSLVALAVLANGNLAHGQARAAKTPKETVVNAFRAINRKTSLAASIDASNSSMKDFDSTVNIGIASPRAYYSNYVGGGSKFETIKIGDKEYSNNFGKWTVKNDPMGSHGTNLQILFGDVWLSVIKNVKSLGDETVGDGKIAIYEYDVDEDALNAITSAKMGMPGKFPNQFLDHKMKVWINAEGLPVKTEDVRHKAGDVTIRKVTTIRYDERVVVEAPLI